MVRIERPDGGLGSGFVFRDRRWVLTAWHVVDLGRDVRVIFPGGRVLHGHAIAVDAEHDPRSSSSARRGRTINACP